MNDHQLAIRLDRPDGKYTPGESIRAEVEIRTSDTCVVDAIELSVLWYSVGKGEEDLDVHFFRREECNGAFGPNSVLSRRVECVLPQSPVSYDGVLVKICWCVRARVYFVDGSEKVEDMPFRLGDASSATLPTAEHNATDGNSA